MITFAFIFARGGSKGLPGKNIMPLIGKPLIVYSIESALNTPFISRVFVSTDDEAIATIAKAEGAIIIDRPAHLATDKSPEWLSWQHACQWASERYGDFDCFVSLPPTSPLRHVDDICAAIEQWENNGDVCISVTPSSRNPFFNMVTIKPTGAVEVVNRAALGVIRRQDAPEVFDITTVVYTSSPEFILQHDGLFSGQVTSIQIPKDRAVDIDDIYDFLLAEAILNLELKKNRGQ